MKTVPLREFLRNLAAMSASARAGNLIRIKTRDTILVFGLEAPLTRSLVGCCAHLAPPKKKSSPGPVEDPEVWESNQ